MKDTYLLFSEVVERAPYCHLFEALLRPFHFKPLALGAGSYSLMVVSPSSRAGWVDSGTAVTSPC